MLTGWIPKFKYNRDLDVHESAHHLPYDVPQKLSPDDAIGMTRFNSTFVEFVDRTFKVKGMAVTALMVPASLFLLWVFVFIVVGDYSILENSGWIFTSLMLAPVFIGGPILFWVIYLRQDLFQYTHCPIRFNRKTRKVYFFRHNGPGGVVTVPWGDPNVYFHIGQGGQNKELRDLRCHVLDEHGLVQQTFTVGHFWDHENRVREEWELIRRYMEEGPDKCFDHPADRMVALSTRMTWRNCWLLVCLMMGTNFYPLRWNLLFPIYGGLTLSRWLTMKTCRKPVFPPEVEAECAIEPGDRYRLPEPSFMAEFAEGQAIDERSAERHRQRQRWK